MPVKLRHLSIILLAIGAVLAGYTLSKDAESPKPTVPQKAPVTKNRAPKPQLLPVSVEAGAVGISFEVGDKIGYGVTIRTNYAVSAGQALTSPAGSNLPAAGKQVREVNGTFLGRVLSKRTVNDAQVWTLAGLMHNVRATEQDSIPITALEQGLTLPILFELNEYGRITGIAGNPETRVEIHNEWQLFLQLIEFALSDTDAKATAWDASQTDSTGTYLAGYKRVDEARLARLQRQRKTYTSVHQPQGNQQARQSDAMQVKASILFSDAVAVWTPNKKWFYELRLREHMKLRVQERSLGEADTVLTMKQIDPNSIDIALWSLALKEGDFSWRRSSQLALPAKALPYSNRPPIPGLAEKTLVDVLQELNALLNIKPQADFDTAITMLVQYLRLKPEMAQALLNEIRKGDLPDAVASLAFLGLELAGGDIAHNTLVEAMHDGELSRMNRMRATSALGDVPDPNRKTVDRLLEVAKGSSRDEDESEIKRSAKLGLGVLAGSETLDKESREVAQQALEDELESSDQPNDLTLALDAIGNSKDASFKEEVAALTSHNSPVVQIAAYRNLNRIGSLPPGEELLERFREEENHQVKQEMARHLISHDNLESTDVDVAITWLQTYPDTDVRRTLIQVIGKAANSHPNAKPALIAHFKVEKDVKLKVLIGKYVSATDLQ